MFIIGTYIVPTTLLSKVNSVNFWLEIRAVWKVKSITKQRSILETYGMFYTICMCVQALYHRLVWRSSLLLLLLWDIPFSCFISKSHFLHPPCEKPCPANCIFKQKAKGWFSSPVLLPGYVSTSVPFATIHPSLHPSVTSIQMMLAPFPLARV